jgi:hypothetical protein
LKKLIFNLEGELRDRFRCCTKTGSLNWWFAAYGFEGFKESRSGQNSVRIQHHITGGHKNLNEIGAYPMKQVFEVDERTLEQAGAKGAERIARDLKDQIGDIRMLGRLKTGLITVKDICRLFGVRERTIHNWPLEPAVTPTQKNLYRVDDVGDQLTGAS